MITACVGPPPDVGRRAWLVEQLVRDDRIWLDRDPALLATKYQVMAADPYDFFRGSAGVYFRDLARPVPGRPRTAFLEDAAGAEVLLVGDPHPENFGAFLPGDPSEPLATGLRVDVNDLDAAAFGPWVLDVRRAAVGVALLVDDLPGCDPQTCRDVAVAAVAEGYVAGVRATGMGRFDRDAWGEAVRRLLDKAEEDEAVHDRVGKETETVDGHRRFVREPLDEAGKGMLSLTASESAELHDLVVAYAADPAAPVGFRVLDAVRRFGRGVSSLPAVRYAVLYDRGDDGPDDDGLLVLREVVDPPAIPSLFAPVTGVLVLRPEDRVPEASRRLWAVADSDPRLAGLDAGTRAFKVLSWSDAFEGFDHVDLAEDVADGTVGVDDLVGLARLIGTLLGGAHGRAPTAGGRAGAAREAIVGALQGRDRGFVDEVVAAAAYDLQRVRDDHRLLREAIDDLGPHLGAAWVDVEDLP